MQQRQADGRSHAQLPDDSKPPGGPPPLLGIDAAWNLLLDARRRTTEGDAGSRLEIVVGEPGLPPGRVVLDKAGRRCLAGGDRFDPAARQLLDLFLDLALHPAAGTHVHAMLGQSLDGYIATQGGDSRYVNDAPSLVYQHRLRALSDAVLIGASTAVLDRPRLTTRHAPGPNPVRVVLDPRRRLPADHGLLHDGAARTLLIRGAEPGHVGPEGGLRRLSDQAAELHLPLDGRGFAPQAIVAALRRQGLTRLMVEGGGVTVTRFLAAHALDRLQLAVAPLLLGRGRPAIDLPAVERLAQGLRPRTRVFAMGCDVLFDMMLHDNPAAECDPWAGWPQA